MAPSRRIEQNRELLAEITFDRTQDIYRARKILKSAEEQCGSDSQEVRWAEENLDRAMRRYNAIGLACAKLFEKGKI